MLKFPCNSCTFSTRHFPLLLRHYRVMHAYQRGFRVACGIEHCQKSFSVIGSFTKHIKRKHPRFHDLNMSVRDRSRHCEEIGRSEDSDNDQHMIDISGADDRNFVNNGNHLGNEGQHLIQKRYDYTQDLALFILNLRERKKLPLNACPDVIYEIKELFHTCEKESYDAFVNVLKRNDINVEQLHGFSDVFQSFTSANLACENLASVYKQNLYFVQNFDYVEPIEIVVAKNQKEKPQTYMYVPILNTLKALLKHEDVLAEVLNGHFAQDGFLGDFCDGILFKEHPLFISDRRSLQIQLYCDEFQVVNPLGTKIKKFKLMGVYFLLGNLQPKQRAKLHSIQLAILCPAHLIKSFGWGKILMPLLKDIKSLETDGISVEVDGSPVEIKGTLSMVVTDNLAAHAVSGLTESFSALRNCRFCNITRELMQSEFVTSNLTPRTPEMYDSQVSLIEKDPSLISVYGIKEKSVLNELKYFHAIGSLPSDIAHDIFEGFGSELLQIVIKEFVGEGFFTLKDLNKTITGFPYSGTDKVNKPSNMSEEMAKFKIKQTACQTWCLLRLLPIMVGEKVPEDHPHMCLLTDFLDILDLICAPVIAAGDAAYLGDLIEWFLTKFFELCSDATVKPKAHYLLHYANQMLKFGPLKHCWTLRFEGKHNYFKEIANRTKNRINICKTLATRHQYMQCIHYASDNFLESEVTDSIKGRIIPVRLLNDCVQGLLGKVIGEKEVVYQVDAATFEGTKYFSGGVVLTGYEEDTYKFGLVECLFDLGGGLYLLVKDLVTQCFNKHYHGYVVEEESTWKLVQPRHLFDIYPLGLYSINGEKVVVLKYRVACRLP